MNMRPEYELGEEVRVIRNLRNDGTYPGKNTGEMLIKRGSIGFVDDYGVYLQDQLIYSVRFMSEGKTVGCRGEELILSTAPWVENKFEFNQKVISKIPLVVDGETIIEKNQQGLVMKVLRDSEKKKVSYHVHFNSRLFQMPEAALVAVEMQPGRG